MNAKTWLPLALAIVLGLVAMLVAKQMVLNKPVAAELQDSTLKTIVVANDNILPGQEVNQSMFVTAKGSKEMAAEDVVTDPAELNGRVTQAPIYKGQPVLAKLLAPKGTAGGLQALVPNGMRAITIEVNEFTGVGGFLVPGCRVDLVSTVQGDKETGEMMSQTIVQNVMVTAIGQRMTLAKEGEQQQPWRSVTLIASPEEAQAIELAAAMGRPRLVLRNQRDDSKDVGPGVTLSDIRGVTRSKSSNDPFATVAHPGQPDVVPTSQPSQPFQPTAMVEETGPRNWNIKVIRGGQTSEVTIPLPAEKTKKPVPQRNKQGKSLLELLTGTNAEMSK